MTPQEALNWCEQFSDNLVMVDVDTKRRTLGLQAMQTCKSALEKQIPEKAIVNENYLNMKYTVGICPNCKEMLGLLVYAKTYKYCCECGLALDWSDTE